MATTNSSMGLVRDRKHTINFIVKTIIEVRKGTVWAKSPEGHGGNLHGLHSDSTLDE